MIKPTVTAVFESELAKAALPQHSAERLCLSGAL